MQTENIKKGWKKVKLGDVLSKIVGGGTPSKQVEKYWNGVVFWCSVKDMPEGKYKIDSTQDKITELGLKNSASNLIEKGNIIISTRMGLGRGFINLVDMAINQDLKAIFPNDKIDKSYLFWSYISKGAEFQNIGQGTTVKGIRLEDLKNIEITIPESLETQKKIASILSKYDDLIENNNKRINILEEMAQIIYKEWFIDFKFPGSENVKMIESGTEFGEIPEGWEVKKVEDVIDKISTGKKYDNKKVSKVGNIPVIDQGKSGVIGYHNDEPGVIASIDNPIITFANHTCYQKLIMFPFSAIQNVFALISNTNTKSNILWLYYGTKDLIKFNDYKGHMPEFITKKLLYPGFEITEKFGNLIKPLIIEIYKLQKQNQKLKETRDLLLPKLVSGEVEVESLENKNDKLSPLSNYQRACLFSSIVKNEYNSSFMPTRLRCQKKEYLVLASMGYNVIELFDKKPLGPYSPKERYKGGESIAKKKGYIIEEKGKFKTGNNICEIEKYNSEFDEYIKKVNKFLYGVKDSMLETLATVHYVITILRREIKEISIDSIKNYIIKSPEWEAKMIKENFTDGNIKEALNKLKEMGFLNFEV